MTEQLHFWFDFSCPYAWLGSTRVEALAERTGAELIPSPLLLGGVFRARGVAQNLSATLNPAKARHNLVDLQRHARLFGVPLRFPAGHPIRTVTALRALLAADGPMMPLAHRFFGAYWVDHVDLSTDEGVASVLRAHGLDADAVLARARTQPIKDELRRRTDEGIALGIFGVPAFVVRGELFWGQDRIADVERALGGEPAPALPADDPAAPPATPTDFWFDYSSPYAFIASRRVERMFGDAARWRPMLLGAVFKMVGAPNVPMLEMNTAKRDWSAADMARQADAAGVRGFAWPSGFPLNTVLALRVTLLAGPDSAAGRAFAHRVYEACWVEDRDPSDPALIAALCDEVGLDGADLVARASLPGTKAALRDSTSAAVQAGVFGAPTFVVDPEGDAPALFWGNDRLELALSAARGDDRLFVTAD